MFEIVQPSIIQPGPYLKLIKVIIDFPKIQMFIIDLQIPKIHFANHITFFFVYMYKMNPVPIPVMVTPAKIRWFPSDKTGPTVFLNHIYITLHYG